MCETDEPDALRKQAKPSYPDSYAFFLGHFINPIRSQAWQFYVRTGEVQYVTYERTYVRKYIRT